MPELERHTSAARICRAGTSDNDATTMRAPIRHFDPSTRVRGAACALAHLAHRTAWTGRVAPSTAGSDLGTV